MNKLFTLSLLFAIFMGVSVRAQTQDTTAMLHLQGWICDTYNKPLGNVTIKIVDNNYATITDSSGLYSLGPIPAGKYTTLVRKDGYLSFVEEDIEISKSTAFYRHNYRLRMGADAVPESLLVPRYGLLIGCVYDRQTKEPLPGAIVEIDSSRLMVNTDLDGSFIITRMPAGIHAVKVKMMGFKNKKYNVPISTKTTTQLKATLEAKVIDRASNTIITPRNMIRPENTGSTHTWSKEKIDKLPGH